MKVGKHAKTHESQAMCSKEGCITTDRCVLSLQSALHLWGWDDTKMII